MASKAYIITGLGFGDECKGATVDKLAREFPGSLVVKTTGGPQAAHNVVTDDGRHHTFSQFGSGSFVPGACNHIDRHVLVNPINMFSEAQHLLSLGITDIWGRTSIDDRCMVITPWHIALNKLRELNRGEAKHGSCAQGVGEAKQDDLDAPELTLRVAHLMDGDLRERLWQIRSYKRWQAYKDFSHLEDTEGWEVFKLLDDESLIDHLVDTYTEWSSVIQIMTEAEVALLVESHDLIICEGAQGVLLDEWYGFHPHTTWSTTTHENAVGFIQQYCPEAEVIRLGLTRVLPTRHGAGPFPTEDDTLSGANPLEHNIEQFWQGGFRYGHLDFVLLSYAVDVCGGVDGLSVSCLDLLKDTNTLLVCDGYTFEGNHSETTDLFESDENGILVRIIPGEKDQLDRQERITNVLRRCHPKYRLIKRDLNTSMNGIYAELLGEISERLTAPIVMTSNGPSSASREVHSLLAK